MMGDQWIEISAEMIFSNILDMVIIVRYNNERAINVKLSCVMHFELLLIAPP